MTMSVLAPRIRSFIVAARKRTIGLWLTKQWTQSLDQVCKGHGIATRRLVRYASGSNLQRHIRGSSSSSMGVEAGNKTGLSGDDAVVDTGVLLDGRNTL